MAEYIERENIRERFKARLAASNKGTMGESYFLVCLDVVNTEPAADVRPVVRCKDCKYGVPTKNGFFDDMIACENKDSPCGYSSWLCQLDWFCADSERREVQDDNAESGAE